MYSNLLTQKLNERILIIQVLGVCVARHPFDKHIKYTWKNNDQWKYYRTLIVE